MPVTLGPVGRARAGATSRGPLGTPISLPCPGPAAWSTGLETQSDLGSKAHINHVLAVWPWTSHSPSLSLSVLARKMAGLLRRIWEKQQQLDRSPAHSRGCPIAGFLSAPPPAPPWGWAGCALGTVCVLPLTALGRGAAESLPWLFAGSTSSSPSPALWRMLRPQSGRADGGGSPPRHCGCRCLDGLLITARRQSVECSFVCLLIKITIFLKEQRCRSPPPPPSVAAARRRQE